MYKEKNYNNIQILIRKMHLNNGYIIGKMLEDNNIHRMYLTIMIKEKLMEKVAKGVYIDSNIIPDSYYILGLSTPKIIYSHMSALYFHGLSIKAPDKSYDITVTKKYNVKKLKTHNVFYVGDDVYELGLIKVKTPMGNIIRCYDIERCICDVIRSKKRMDIEHIKYSVREYIKRKDKDIIKLNDYAKKLGIKDEVIEFVAMMY